MELIKKLRIDVEKPVWVLNAPEGIEDLLPGIDIKKKPGKTKPTSQVVLFATDSLMLNQSLPLIADHVSHDTLFWICYPKKTGTITSDLILMKTWDIVFSSGYRAQTSVSINEDWTAMRFTNAPRKKPSVAELPLAARKTEGIDYVNRTVVLPADAADVLNKYTGATDFFMAMSFTHQREHIEAIVDAKKPETRTRRIEKMAEMLLKMIEEKELKRQAKMKK